MPDNDGLVSDDMAARATLEHAALSVPQQQRLDRLRELHHEVDVSVNAGPCGSLEATVTDSGYPPERHIFGRDADEMLARVERAIDQDPDPG